MQELSRFRINLLRATYLLIAVGLFIVMWPGIIMPSSLRADSDTVVRSLLGAMGLLSLLGVRYPVQMLPLMLFEFAWKVIWIVAFALPMAMGPGLDAYGQETLVNCVFGVVLLLLVLPFPYLVRQYLIKPSTPWGKALPAHG